ALVGAELSTPATVPGHGTVFAAPTLAMNKRPEWAAEGRRFLEGVAELLSGFGVATQAVSERPVRTAPGRPAVVRLRLTLSPGLDSLSNLWAKVGYVYNRRRAGLAALAVQYLKLKRRMLSLREGA